MVSKLLLIYFYNTKSEHTVPLLTAKWATNSNHWNWRYWDWEGALMVEVTGCACHMAKWEILLLYFWRKRATFLSWNLEQEQIFFIKPRVEVSSKTQQRNRNCSENPEQCPSLSRTFSSSSIIQQILKMNRIVFIYIILSWFFFDLLFS